MPSLARPSTAVTPDPSPLDFPAGIREQADHILAANYPLTDRQVWLAEQIYELAKKAGAYGAKTPRSFDHRVDVIMSDRERTYRLACQREVVTDAQA